MKLYTALSLASLAVSARGDNHCYNSTMDMLTAQVGGEKEIIICPDTTITIGLPTDAAFTTFAGGDLPLTALGDDVTIKCGEDGSSANNCMLKGGLVQFATSPAIALAPQLPFITTNNLKVQGLTFTGTLQGVPGFQEVAVILSTPGSNMIFEDCVFTDIVGSDIFSVSRNAIVPPEAFPPGSVSVTLKDSVFKKTTYYREVVTNLNQTVTLDNVSFEDVAHEPGSNITSLIYAAGMGSMTIKNCDFSNIEYQNSVAYVRGEDMTIEYSGNAGFNWEAVNEMGENELCTDGLIVAKSEPGTLDLSTEADSCMALTDEPVDMEKESTDGPDTSGGSSMASTMTMRAVILAGLATSFGLF